MPCEHVSVPSHLPSRPHGACQRNPWPHDHPTNSLADRSVQGRDARLFGMDEEIYMWSYTWSSTMELYATLCNYIHGVQKGPQFLEQVELDHKLQQMSIDQHWFLGVELVFACLCFFGLTDCQILKHLRAYHDDLLQLQVIQDFFDGLNWAT